MFVRIAARVELEYLLKIVVETLRGLRLMERLLDGVYQRIYPRRVVLLHDHWV